MTASTATPVDIQRWVEPFAGLIDVARRRQGDQGTAPGWPSEGARFVAESTAFGRALGDPWGVSVPMTLFPMVSMFLEASLQHAEAMTALLIYGPRSPLVLETLTRAILEAATKAWWLCEPGLTARARMGRVFILRRHSATTFELAAGRLCQDVDGAGQTVADIERHYRDELGLGYDLGRKAGFAGSEGQRLPKISDRVDGFFAEIGATEGPYTYYCGSSHTELWRLMYMYTPQPSADGTPLLVPHDHRELTRTSLAIASDTILHTTERVLSFCGRAASRLDLLRLSEPLAQALRA